MKLEFHKISDTLKDYIIWTNENDLYWYKYNWSILEKYKLTNYTDEYDKMIVWLRLYALINLYRSFCELCFDEPWEKEYYFDYEDPNEALVLGQLLGDQHFLEFDSECVSKLVEKYKHDVYSAICSELSINDIFNYIIITAIDDENYNIETYEDYIKSVFNADFTRKTSTSNMEAYDFLLNELPEEQKKTTEKELPDDFYCVKESIINIIKHYLSLNDIKNHEINYLNSVLNYVKEFKCNNNSSEEYIFGFSLIYEQGGCDYISFNIEDNSISVTIGGSVYDEVAGSDSFSNNIYYIQDDGFEKLNDSDSLYNLEDLGIGYINNGATLNIENDKDCDEN